MSLSLEMQQILESTLSYWWRTEPTRCSAGQSAEVRAGSESRANAHWGSPGTWEALSFPCLTNNNRRGPVDQYPGPRMRVSIVRWERSNGPRHGTA